jgi:spore coat protein U-like protein
MKNLSSLRLVAASVLALGVGVANAAIVGEATLAAGSPGAVGYNYMDVTSQNMQVQAEVVANCAITVVNLDFGNYDPIVTHRNGADWLESDGTVTTECTQGSGPKITLTSASSFKMTRVSGTETLDYTLHVDSGTGTAGAAWSGSGEAVTASGFTPVDTLVFGKLAGGQDKPVGVYTDTVVVDITF